MKTAFAAFALSCPLWVGAAERAAAGPEAPPSNEPAVQQIVLEDDGSRIEELRVRGETQRLSVTSKGPFFKSTYDIALPRHGRRGELAGKPLWSVLAF